MKAPSPRNAAGVGGEEGCSVCMKASVVGRVDAAVQEHEPVGLEADLEAEPAAVEVAALAQLAR